jgi:UPF0271 protein
VSLIIKEKKIKTIDGAVIDVAAETICIHADTPNALTFAKTIYHLINNK